MKSFILFEFNTEELKKGIISPNIMNQGSIGNCWWVAVASQLGSSPFQLCEMFYRVPDPNVSDEEGVYESEEDFAQNPMKY